MRTGSGVVPRGGSRSTWAGRAVFGLVIAGLVTYLVIVGLDYSPRRGHRRSVLGRVARVAPEQVAAGGERVLGAEHPDAAAAAEALRAGKDKSWAGSAPILP